MSTNDPEARFQSALAPFMDQFVQEKRACGYQYRSSARLLSRFDQFLCNEALPPGELPLTITRKWLAKRPHETASTHQGRLSVVRQFTEFLCRLGYRADVPDGSFTVKDGASFTPRIFTHAEVQLLLHAVDQLTPDARGPLRHLIMPEVFRLLYGCGFRLDEVLHLRVADVDLDRGVLTVREGKFGKDRLVPPAVSLVQRLQKYAVDFGTRPPDAFFFPAPNGGPWWKGTVYRLFRKLLLRCAIPHAGRGKGPRVHDMRHTFAVHTLLRWYREGADLDAKLPVLATYLGHQSLLGTQRYLHLTAELFPQITVRVNAAFGDVIPRRSLS
ncbi:MAG: tyrosine-type recombinase/integrase [Gammaproteobacteria bacterium]|nr:tyrosine-type recombinase/integrase [Gammaproteobacteria bacterium]